MIKSAKNSGVNGYFSRKPSSFPVLGKTTILSTTGTVTSGTYNDGLTIWDWWRFASSGTATFYVGQSNAVQALLVAGGGGGGGGVGEQAGGGGAGGLKDISLNLTTSGVYTITVGNGGTTDVNGGNSSIVGEGVSESALGGGKGGYTRNSTGGNGGSGGGGGDFGSTGGSAIGPTFTSVLLGANTPQGYAGTSVASGDGRGGGGGGAGGPGNISGVGGVGRSINWHGTTTMYSAGGNSLDGGAISIINNSGQGGYVNASGSSGVVIIRIAK